MLFQTSRGSGTPFLYNSHAEMPYQAEHHIHLKTQKMRLHFSWKPQDTDEKSA